MKEVHPSMKYLREEVLPTPFCPGCGNGIIMNAFFKAIFELGHMDLSKFVFVSGIGCGAWIISPHFKADTLHVAHGRAIPVATGIKLMRPDLNVIVISGDGDLVNIGGNHLIHAARRNIGIKVILVNNMIFGMTGGQFSAETLHGLKTTTTPYGNIEYPFDISSLIMAAGANYVARWTTYHFNPLVSSIKKALTIDGFAFVEVLSQCPTALGRQIGKPDGLKMLMWFKDISILISKAKKLKEDELKNKVIIGEFVIRDRKPLEKMYNEVKEKVKALFSTSK